MKSRPDLFPASVLLGIGDVLSFGETKHPGQPWKRMSSEDHMAAAQRHVLEWLSGNTTDSETGKDHRLHAICRLAFAVAIETQGHPLNHMTAAEYLQRANRKD